jgi:hypothetical protein
MFSDFLHDEPCSRRSVDLVLSFLFNEVLSDDKIKTKLNNLDVPNAVEISLDDRPAQHNYDVISQLVL